MPSISALLAGGEKSLATVSNSARLDAEVLLAFLLGKPRSYMIAWPARAVDVSVEDQYQALIERRRQGEPIAYLISSREFWSLELKVNPNVLIPRPETELLVERAFDIIRLCQAQKILDLGTGSGAIALSLAHKLPALNLTATDISADALSVAMLNAKRLGINNVHFVQSDWFAALTDSFELIVSNPPYIAQADPHLQQGDVRFEPQIALTDGEDGLQHIRRLIAGAPQHLKPGGYLLLEHGYEQGGAVRELLSKHHYSNIKTHKDLSGHERLSEAHWMRAK